MFPQSNYGIATMTIRSLDFKKSFWALDFDSFAFFIVIFGIS
jgi:hypothetical protein